MIFSDFLSDIVIVSFMTVFPVFISWPAISILKRKQCFFVADYGLSIYSIIFFILLAMLCKPVFGPEGVSMFIVDVFFLTIFSVMLTYGKLLILNKVKSRNVSIGGIFIMLIVTATVFFFTPMFGE